MGGENYIPNATAVNGWLTFTPCYPEANLKLIESGQDRNPCQTHRRRVDNHKPSFRISLQSSGSSHLCHPINKLHLIRLRPRGIEETGTDILSKYRQNSTWKCTRTLLLHSGLGCRQLTAMLTSASPASQSR